jgi:flagellum-specific ATP synthase
VLLGMMARYTAADVIVVGLIGERGREVKEFIEDILGDEGRARSVVVAAPADAPPLVRMQGASYATAIAEHFRDRGQHVLLLMDSLTRYAMAQREIALAIGEPPATKGYPPSCLRQAAAAGGAQRQRPGRRGLDHRLLHRAQRGRRPAGPDRRRGARHPRRPHRALARAGRGRPLPGHRRRALGLARDDRRGRREHLAAARRMRQLLAKVNKARDLIQLGAYAARPRRRARHRRAPAAADERLLQQDMHESAALQPRAAA